MSKRREREPCSSVSSQEASPNPKNIKMADDQEHVQRNSESPENLPTLAMIYEILMDVQRNTKSIMEEYATLKKEQEKLKKAVEFQSKTIDELREENTELLNSLSRRKKLQ